MKSNGKNKVWNVFMHKHDQKKDEKKENNQYHNEIKIEIVNTPENDEILISTGIAFVSARHVSEESFDTVRKMIEEELEDFRDTNPNHDKIIFKMTMDDLIFAVESSTQW